MTKVQFMAINPWKDSHSYHVDSDLAEVIEEILQWAEELSDKNTVEEAP